MKPTATDMLEILDHILETQITPLLPDEHARARMAVASQVIRAVHNRLRLEGPMLAADNADLVGLLAELKGTDVEGAEPEYVPVETLAARNEELRAELVELMNGIDDLPADQRPGKESALNTYLRRQLDRELAVTKLPTFGATTAELPLV